MMKKFQIISRK
jgi:hypothetical protein